MPGKHYVRLGKTKLIRLPEGMESWIKEVARELDTKDDPEEVMRVLASLLDRMR